LKLGTLGSRAIAKLTTRMGRRVALAVSTLAVSMAGLAAAVAVADADPAKVTRVQKAAPRPGKFEQQLDVTAFHKGNLHTHSIVSDGDVPPADVYAWYRDHGYQFLALTDHNTRVEPKVYAHLERPGFKIIAGEEVTMKGAGREVHVNSLCSKDKIGGGKFATQAEALRWAIDRVNAQGGVALINHPNFDWSLSEESIMKGGTRAALVEVWSGHPYVYSKGADGRPSNEALWDKLLDRGARLSAVSVDDTHHFQTKISPHKASRPGRGWISVYATPGADVEVGSTCAAIREGRFFASSGAGISHIRTNQGTLTVWPDDARAVVSFIGRGGTQLAAMRPGADGASYTLRGGESWVRVRVDDPNGKQAWTQAFRVAEAPLSGDSAVARH
jgi:hypothetical protein